MMAGPVPAGLAMSIPSHLSCVVQPRLSRQRFALQCAAVALFLAVLVAMGVAGSNVRATPGGQMPTKPSNPTNYPTIEALLRESPHDTAVVLVDVWEASRAERMPEAQHRFDNLLNFLEFVDARGVRVAAVTRVAQGASKIEPGRLLPADFVAVLRNVRPEYIAYREDGAGVSPRFNAMNNGQAAIDASLQGVRNIILIGHGTDNAAYVPTFEAVWHRRNVYRNVNLDSRVDEWRDLNYIAKFSEQMNVTPGFQKAESLRLPTPLAADPHLHYVPIGSIPGVLETLPYADYEGSFTPAGIPWPHEHAPETQERSSLGAFADIQQYEAQIHLMIRDDSLQVVRHEYAKNSERMAYALVPKVTALAFHDQTIAMSDAQTRQAVLDMGIKQVSTSVPFPDQRGEAALRHGLVELTIDGHGMWSETAPVYRVGYQLPRQLGAMIVEHPDLPIASALANGVKPVIAHLRLRACGIRCNPTYTPGRLDPTLPDDEVDYGKQLVRWLARNGVDVKNVSVHNAKIVLSPSGGEGLAGSWFVIPNSEGKFRAFAFESQSLTTTLAYDAGTDTFVENPTYRSLPKVELVDAKALPPATHADIPRANTDGTTPDWIADDVTGQPASPGVAQMSASGAVLAIKPAINVPPRLEASSKRGVDWAALKAVEGKTGTVVTAADLTAIAAGTRRGAGQIVVVDTDPSRLDGVRAAVFQAAMSTNPADWVAKLQSNELISAGGDFHDMWVKLATQWWPTPGQVYADPNVVEAFNALKARAFNYSFHGADITTADGGALVNAHLGREPVVLMWLPTDDLFLLRSAMLGSTATRKETLHQLRLNLALMMGPETTLWQQQARSHMTWGGEQAFRDHHRLPGASPVSDSVGANQGTVTTESREQALVEGLDEALDSAGASERERESLLDIADDRHQGRLHEWWTQAREALASLAGWIRARFSALMQALGLWEGPAVQTPAEAATAQADDPVVIRMEAQRLGTQLLQSSREVLAAHALDPHDWVPVLETTTATGTTACPMSGCTTRVGETEYEMRWLHESNGEERIVRTRDPVFAKVRAFIGEHVVGANAEATGGHVSSMNAAFALMGLAHILQANKELQQGDLPGNLATSLQVQMYLGEAQAVAGVAKDVVEVVKLAREGLREAASVAASLGQTVTLEARLLRTLGTTMDVAAGAASAALVGVDIYNLVNAKTDTQRAVYGAQLGVDSTALGVTVGAIVAEMAGAATASTVLGTIAVPLAGLGIGIVGLVEAFMAVAQDVDTAAAKFDKFADLYARPGWREDEDPLVAISHPTAPTMRRPYTWDAKTRTLQPVHGVAMNRVDLRTRDGQGKRKTAMAESYIDRAGPAQSGSQSVIGSRPTLTGGNVPQGDRNAAPIPILARSGIYPTGTLPIESADKVDVLIVPATPASRFHSYEYQNLADAHTRHREEAGFMGYEVLRRLENSDWNAGFFIYDFDLNAIAMIMRRVQEDWIATTVDLVLDDDVHTIAWPEFVIPKDTKWTADEQKAYNASNRQMRGNMRYRLNPSGRTAPYALSMQDGYGSIELQATTSGKATTWMLDARHLSAPDAISVSVDGKHGVLRISGNEVRIAGVSGATPAAGEGTAEAYVVLAHGVWHVDFLKRELLSKDLLAATDLVHDKHVQDALKRKGFSWRSDGFVELTGSPTRTFPVHGAHVQRYYQSVRDETLVYAIEDRYPKATLIFGDGSEALFHNPDTGQLLRVPRGSVRPTKAYVIGGGFPPVQQAIKRVDRLDNDTFLVLVEYARRQPAYFIGTPAPDINEGMTIAYRLQAESARIVALMGHHRLGAHLEEVDNVTPNDVAYGDFMAWLGTIAQVDFTPRQAGLTALVPVPAEWVSVNGLVRVPAGDVARQYWVRAKDGHLLKPLFPGPSATCRAGSGAADGFKVRQAVTSAGCALAHPGDAVMLDTFQGPAAESGSATTTWRRFYSASLGALYGVRAYSLDTSPAQYPRTQLMTVGKGGGIAEGEDGAGLAWRQSASGWQLAGVGVTYPTAKPDTWFKALIALVASQPNGMPAASPLPVAGLLDRHGARIFSWYTPGAERWTLALPGMRLVDDGARPPYRAIVQDEAGMLWYSATLPTAAFEAMLDGRKLRGEVKLDAVKAPSGLGKPVSLTSRRDAQCEGTAALYANGTSLCLSATGKPRVLDMAWCPSQPTPVRPAGTEAEYVQLACTTDGNRARSGCLAPTGERIAAPNVDALADAAGHRLLGFNRELRQAYFFHPAQQILYVTNWAGALVRRNWVADANIAGEALFLQLARNGLSPHDVPRIDGVATLGLASASHYTTHYVIDAALWVHYPRMVIDMGDVPDGSHQRHELSLLFSEASKLVVQGWPGGWRAHDADMARQIELRGVGGNKWLYFGDTGHSMDLANVRPVSFLELPKAGFTPPPADAPFTDRLDVDGDNIADLVWLANVNGQGRLRWQLRNADGTTRGLEVRSDVPMPWTSAATHYRFASVDGTSVYCAWQLTATIEMGPAGMNCKAIDHAGVRPAGHEGAPRNSPPPTPANFDAAIPATVRSAQYLHFQPDPTMTPRGQLVRFNGTDFECVSDPEGCTPLYSLTAARPTHWFSACPATTPTQQAPAWCQRARDKLDPNTVIGPWRSDAAILNGGFWTRLNQGDVECMAYDGRSCIAKTSVAPDFGRAKPLTCGAMMQIEYGTQYPWCDSLRGTLGAEVATPPTAGSIPEVINLRIEGDLRIGQTLRGEYTFHHAGGAREGASLYQWSFVDTATGLLRPINGAKSRTYTLRPEDQGPHTIRFTIERIVASTGDASSNPISTQRQGITGNAPEMRYAQLEGRMVVGETVRLAYEPYDADGDVFGGSTFKWCVYANYEYVPKRCTDWTTTNGYTIVAADAGHRIGVIAIARTLTGSPNASGEGSPALSALVTGAPPEVRNLRIEGQARLGVVLRAAFDPFDGDNDTFGGTTYQWCEYPAEGNTPNGCAAWSTSDSWTVTAGNVGKRLAVKVIPRTTTGSPNVGAEVASEKTGVITNGNAPQALNLRIHGELKSGGTLQALFTGFDVEGDPFGGTTYQWCEYAPGAGTHTSCTAWSTSDRYTVTVANVGMQLAVKVLPRTTSGTPNVGTEAVSARTANIAWAPPAYARDHVLPIPDTGAWVESTIYVPDTGTMNDARANVRITHPNIGDLQVELVSPRGTKMMLHNRTGGGDDNLNKEFKFLDVYGTNQRGMWTLRIRDAGTGFTGALQGWSLSFQGASATTWPGPTAIEGLYRIRIARMQLPSAAADNGCLSAEGNGTGTVPSINATGPAPLLCTVPTGSAKALWDVSRNDQVAKRFDGMRAIGP
jgi:subtilisin-like proprotein convertase family protein